MRVLIILMISFGIVACDLSTGRPMPSNEDERIKLGPDERSGIVFFFVQGTPMTEQTKFMDGVLSVQLTANRGRWPLPGVKSTFGTRVEGFDGFAINFLEDSTEQQKQEVIRRLNDSPLVYKVYRNAIPSQIEGL